MVDDFLRSLGFRDESRVFGELHRWDAFFAHIPEDYCDASLFLEGSGIRLASFMTSEGVEGELLSCYGEGGHPVRAFQVRPGLAYIDYLITGELAWRFLCQVDDPFVYPTYSMSAICRPLEIEDFLISAVAVAMEVYEDETDFGARHGCASDAEAMIGTRYIASPWLFPLYSGTATPELANAAAMLHARCERVELRRNSLTGEPWYRLSVDCGFRLALAIRGDIEPAPTPGSIIAGRALLFGSSGFWESTSPLIEHCSCSTRHEHG